MKKALWITGLMTLAINGMAQSGPVGFCNYNDGINGITGGMGGEIVTVTTKEDLAKYLKDDVARIVLLKGKLTGTGLDRTKEVISVGSNKTLVGVGKDAELAGIGLDVNGKQNIIIRNLTIHHADPDGIACRNTHHVWVDHCEIYSQDEEKEDWDGLIDLTVGSSYLTVSYCYIHDHHKCCLLNSGTMHFEDNGKNRATYHHNAFRMTDQRNPRIGYGLGHVFNNFYEKIGHQCIGIHTQAQVYSENNYFSADANNPFLQMYASSIDDASCGFAEDRGSYFGQGIPGGLSLIGTDFRPSEWYDYGCALDSTDVIPDLYPLKVGPQEGLEKEVILWPGNGAIDLPATLEPKWSKLPDETNSWFVMGEEPTSMTQRDLKETPLAAGKTYYWQVTTQVGDSTYLSPVYRFTTAQTKATTPYPADGETNAKLRVAPSESAKTSPMSLAWHPAFDAKSYRVSLWDSTGKAILDKQTISTTSVNPGTLLYGEPYTWRVDVVKSDGTEVPGDVWSFSAPACYIHEGNTEMEHLARSAYAYLEREDGAWFKASNDSVTVGEAGPGSMTGIFDGEEGEYEMSVTFYDEKSGKAWMGVSINDELLDSWTGNKTYAMTTHTLTEHVGLMKGDQIRVDFYTQSKMRCRIDCLNLKLIKRSVVAIEEVGIDQISETRCYNLMGMPIGGSQSGVVVYDHRKIIIRQ